MAGPVTRRALVGGVGAALAVAVIPASGEVIPSVFDPTAYVADLRAIGCRLGVWRRMRAGGAWSYSIGAPEGGGFGRAHLAVMRKWDAAIGACPDHGAQVAAVLIAEGNGGRT